jgi:hypothetical protein
VGLITLLQTSSRQLTEEELIGYIQRPLSDFERTGCYINPLKPERERERERERRGVVRNAILTEGNRKASSMKVPGQCPLVLLVKVVWREGKTLGSGEGKALGSDGGKEFASGPKPPSFFFFKNIDED